MTRGRLVAALLTAAVILAISRDDLGGIWWWTIPGVTAVSVGLAVALPRVAESLPAGVTPGLIVGAAAAGYACVPETDQYPWITLVPATMAVTELRLGRHLATPWLFGAAGVVLWAGVYGATGRGSAMVGALFAWFPLLAAPVLGARLRRLREPWLVTSSAVLLPMVIGTVVVARTGGLEPSVGPALFAAAVAAPASLVVSFILTSAFRGGTARERLSSSAEGSAG